jgi:hypothetical protein
VEDCRLSLSPDALKIAPGGHANVDTSFRNDGTEDIDVVITRKELVVQFSVIRDAQPEGKRFQA